jgi:hypothetical protein
VGFFDVGAGEPVTHPRVHAAPPQRPEDVKVR